MDFLHDGRPPVVRQGHEQQARRMLSVTSSRERPSWISTTSCKKILASLNVCSKEWIIRQYDHEVQGGSVVKPLVGAANDGPGDAAVVMPVLGSWQGLGDRLRHQSALWRPRSLCHGGLAIDEAVRNVVAVGADPSRIAMLDNFCWGNTERPEVLGSLVRAAQACRDVALAYSTPFISGKDSLNNEYTRPASATPRKLRGISSSRRRC